MKCKCGGNIVYQRKRIKLQIRDKKYYPLGYKCDNCQRDCCFPLIHIPISNKL